ncbi:MAG: NAD(P)/FAD-dependent oxidoreductase [Eubacteriales bacterium]|nr:NAD(P)/FAD-dependent oxidoreductase [Eubacteriales bacterium]
MYDCLVIGAGPAGVSAALYARSRGLEIAVIEADSIGGLIAQVSVVSHFTGLISEENGRTFSARLSEQLEAAEIPVIYDSVERIQQSDGGFTVIAANQSYRAKTVIAAMGSRPKSLGLVADEEAYVSHRLPTEISEIQDREIVLCGGSDGAAKEALFLAQYAKRVHMIQDREDLFCIAEFRQRIERESKIVVHLGARVTSIQASSGQVTAVQTTTDETIACEAVYAYIGQMGNYEPLMGLLPESASFIDLESVVSPIPGLYVVGDLRKKTVRQVATAVADGCEAGILASAYVASL